MIPMTTSSSTSVKPDGDRRGSGGWIWLDMTDLHRMAGGD
jgi:hypothetical protein